MTIAQVIQDNNWQSVSFEKSTDVNALINSGVITRAGESANALLSAISYDNVQSTLTVGLVDSTWAEQNLGDASDTTVTGIEAVFDEVNVKTFYGNQWWAVRTIQKDLLNTTKPITLVGERIGSYWATQWNRIISATISGMADIAEITVGEVDGVTGLPTQNLDRLMVVDAMSKKGDMGFGALDRMYMNSVTFADQLKKQITAGDQLFTRAKANTLIGTNGKVVAENTNRDTWVYDNATPIILDDTMKNGIISLVSDGAFAFEQKNMTSPLMYNNDPKAGNGAGKEEFGTKALYILHPIGFSFVGVQGTNYASKSGLSLAELQAGGLYALKVDAKLAPITNLRVKIGA